MSRRANSKEPGPSARRKRGTSSRQRPARRILLGVQPGVPPEAIHEAIRGGGLAALLQRHRVAAGDAYLVPAGTLHAIGPGVLVYEIQQPSDITYRCDDWGRPPSAGRPLHIEQSLVCVRPEPWTETVRSSAGTESPRPAHPLRALRPRVPAARSAGTRALRPGPGLAARADDGQRLGGGQRQRLAGAPGALRDARRPRRRGPLSSSRPRTCSPPHRRTRSCSWRGCRHRASADLPRGSRACRPCVTWRDSPASRP